MEKTGENADLAKCYDFAKTQYPTLFADVLLKGDAELLASFLRLAPVTQVVTPLPKLDWPTCHWSRWEDQHAAHYPLCLTLNSWRANGWRGVDKAGRMDAVRLLLRAHSTPQVQSSGKLAAVLACVFGCPSLARHRMGHALRAEDAVSDGALCADIFRALVDSKGLTAAEQRTACETWQSLRRADDGLAALFETDEWSQGLLAASRVGHSTVLSAALELEQPTERHLRAQMLLNVLSSPDEGPTVQPHVVALLVDKGAVVAADAVGAVLAKPSWSTGQQVSLLVEHGASLHASHLVALLLCHYTVTIPLMATLMLRVDGKELQAPAVADAVAVWLKRLYVPVRNSKRTDQRYSSSVSHFAPLEQLQDVLDFTPLAGRLVNEGWDRWDSPEIEWVLNRCPGAMPLDKVLPRIFRSGLVAARWWILRLQQQKADFNQSTTCPVWTKRNSQGVRLHKGTILAYVATIPWPHGHVHQLLEQLRHAGATAVVCRGDVKLTPKRLRTFAYMKLDVDSKG